MCCVHVVPLLGYEQMKISEERNGRLRHAAKVDGEVIGRTGIGGKLLQSDDGEEEEVMID